MKIFISWSGDLSNSIADIFRKWIPGVIQAAKPYYTPDDITKGTRWNNEISKVLDQSKIGIICLTKENLKSPWIMFEAGALSKNLEKSKVCPLLFGIEPSDVEGPLVQFQAAKFSKTEMKKVIKMINSELDDKKLADNVLDNVFNKWWPDLESQICDAIEESKIDDSQDLRSDRDILEEVLFLSRELSIDRKNNESEFFQPAAFTDLLFGLEELISKLSPTRISRLQEPIDSIFQALNYILDQGSLYWGSSFKDKMDHNLENIRLNIDRKRHIHLSDNAQKKKVS